MRQQFFSDKGITSTSANYIANMAKEYIKTLKIEIKNLSYVKETVKTAGEKFDTKRATPTNVVVTLDDRIKKIAKATQLIAWLREAIKEKQDLTVLSILKWCQQEGLEYPEDLKTPVYLTQEDIIKTWSVDKYNAFITAQTYAAVYGEMVHPDGAISKAREELLTAETTPYVTSHYGRDFTVTSYTPVYSIEQVDKQFFELQQTQREYQAKYNNYLHEIETLIQEDTETKQAKYAQEAAAIQEQRAVIVAQYNTYASKQRAINRNLKIAIPDQLLDIYTIIQGLSK